MIANRFALCRAALVAMAIGLAILAPARPQPARAQEAPFGLVDWKPIAGNPVFAGTGNEHLGPQDPRARLYPGGRRRDLSPLVHRVRSRPTGHNVPGPCDVARWNALDSRPAQPDLHRVVGRGYVRRQAGRYLSDVCRGEERYRAPAEFARRCALDRSWLARHPQDRWDADQSRPLRHSDRLVRERHVVSLLRARRPGGLAGHVAGPQNLDQRQGRSSPGMGPDAYDATPSP